MQATRALVHLDNFLRNFKLIQERIGPQRRICLPVKADAYGHGAAAIARAGLEAGAAFLGVARVQEGADLRQEGINAPILLFSQPLPEEIPELIKYRLIPFVADQEFAILLDKAAAEVKIRLPVHLKVDTGMGRMGCSAPEAPALAKFISACAALEYAGTATHLAVADSAAAEDIAYTGRQIACFNEALDGIRAAGLNPGIVHAANSGAIIQHPDAWYDMVRPGILVYGYKTVEEFSPLPTPQGGIAAPPLPILQVEPVMELRTNVALIKQVKKGESVSYGRTWIAPYDTSVAVLPVGYGDGLPRLLSNNWQVYIGGKAYPLVGRICMDQCMADLGHSGEGVLSKEGVPVRRWDEAVFFGGPAPSAAVLAKKVGTIPYEITCNINKRVPRVYV
jgi:alanine racemase